MRSFTRPALLTAILLAMLHAGTPAVAGEGPMDPTPVAFASAAPATPHPDARPVEVRTSPDAAPRMRPLRSLKALRTANMFLQQTDYSCGAAALATILREHFLRDVDEDSVIAGMLPHADLETVRRAGFSLLDMRRYVESIGLRGRGFKVGVERLFDLKVPAITLLERDGIRHFVVVKRAAAGRVFIADPSYGHRSMRIEDFAEQWSGVLLAITGPGANPDSALTRGIGAPALAYRADAARIDIQRASLDYGFRSLDLF